MLKLFKWAVLPSTFMPPGPTTPNMQGGTPGTA